MSYYFIWYFKKQCLWFYKQWLLTWKCIDFPLCFSIEHLNKTNYRINVGGDLSHKFCPGYLKAKYFT